MCKYRDEFFYGKGILFNLASRQHIPPIYSHLFIKISFFSKLLSNWMFISNYIVVNFNSTLTANMFKQFITFVFPMFVLSMLDRFKKKQSNK